MSSLTFFFVFAAILAILFLAVNFLLAPHNPYREKYSIFECGFHSYLSQSRTQFNNGMGQAGLLFLLLDLDILIVYPFSQSQSQNESYGLIVALFLIGIVTAGFVFEIGKGVLKIESRQINTQLAGEGEDKSIIKGGNNRKELVFNSKKK